MDRLSDGGARLADPVVLARATPEAVRQARQRQYMPGAAPRFRCCCDVDECASGPPRRRAANLRGRIEPQSIRVVIGRCESGRSAGARAWMIVTGKAPAQALEIIAGPRGLGTTDFHELGRWCFGIAICLVINYCRGSANLIVSQILLRSICQLSSIKFVHLRRIS